MPRKASHWAFVAILIALNIPVGHASVRHTNVTQRTRVRSASWLRANKPDGSDRLAESIVGFARRAEGRQVGDGECFSLADQALSQAGAQSAAYYTDITPDGDYIWGKPVSVASARPGDILQFRNFRIVRRITTTITGADGALARTQSEEVEERDHHTAIVTQNLGTVLAVAEQNVEPLGRVVQRNTIETVSGTTTRVNPADRTVTTTEIFLDGELRAYRPQHAARKILAASVQPGS